MFGTALSILFIRSPFLKEVHRCYMSKLVPGKLAFVTGAGGGIGKEICRVLDREGAIVIATDCNIKSAQRTIATLEGKGHVALDVEVSNRESIETAFKDAIKHFSKPPTIIINAAGIIRDNFMTELSDIDFENVINVNLKGTFLVMQIAIKAMIEANATNSASIVNISSIVGKTGNIGQSNYSASKAGVEALTKCASMEFGKFGIRINTVLPGLIETSMTTNIPSKIKEIIIKKLSLRRAAQPQEVAEVIVFLASDRSSYISGASIEITGGIFGTRVNTVLPGLTETPMTTNIPSEIKKIIIKKISLRRAAQPQEVAEVIVFLASDKSSYINGASIEITGGMR